MAATTFASYLPSLAPRPLQGPVAQAFFTAAGAVLDAKVQRARDAVLARHPVFAPPDGLPLIGQDRQLPQGPSESTASYRARLQAAFPAWAWSGTATGLLQYALAPAGYANAAIIRNRDWVNTTVSHTTGSGTAVISGRSFMDLTQVVGLEFSGPAPCVMHVTHGTASANFSINTGPVSISINAAGKIEGGATADAQIVIDLSNGAGLTASDTYELTFTPNPPDGDVSKWARFWIVLGTSMGVRAWDDGHWADGNGDWPTGTPTETWDSTWGPDQVAFLQTIVNLWKPARDLCMGAFVTGTTSVAIDQPPQSGNWLEENATSGGLPVTFFRWNGVVQGT